MLVANKKASEVGKWEHIQFRFTPEGLREYQIKEVTPINARTLFIIPFGPNSQW